MLVLLLLLLLLLVLVLVVLVLRLPTVLLLLLQLLLLLLLLLRLWWVKLTIALLVARLGQRSRRTLVCNQLRHFLSAAVSCTFITLYKM